MCILLLKAFCYVYGLYKLENKKFFLNYYNWRVIVLIKREFLLFRNDFDI